MCSVSCECQPWQAFIGELEVQGKHDDGFLQTVTTSAPCTSPVYHQCV